MLKLGLTISLMMSVLSSIDTLAPDTMYNVYQFLGWSWKKQKEARLLSKQQNNLMLQFSPIRQLSSLICNYHELDTSQRAKLMSLSNELKLDAMYGINFPHWLEKSYKRLQHGTPNYNYHDFEDLSDILNTHSIGIDEIINKPIPDSLKLLIITSRGLMQCVSPTLTAKIQLRNEPKLSNVPWMRAGYDIDWVPFFTYYYERLLKEQFGLSSIDEVYHLKNDDYRKQKLLDLNQEYGLILWNETWINLFRRAYYSHRRNIILCFEKWLDYEDMEPFQTMNLTLKPNDIRTQFVVEMAEKYGMRAPKSRFSEVEILLNDLHRYNVEKGKFHEAQCIADILNRKYCG